MPRMFSPHTVQLQHDLPDGSSHIDWMLDLTRDGASPLTTFRLGARVDRLGPGDSIAAERIGDHRRDYLEYEGPISGDRGSVRRLAVGTLDAVQSIGQRWAFLVRWWDEPVVTPLGRSQQLLLAPGAESWTVRCAAG